MARLENNFYPEHLSRADAPQAGQKLCFEIFVNQGFCALEVGSITQTLALANEILDQSRFTWRHVSDRPGLVTGTGDMIVRAEPAINDHGFSNVMIVVGGDNDGSVGWLNRARQMQRKGHVVALLSSAATAYIRATRSPSRQVTTHWHDAALLSETGYYPALTDTLSEKSDGIITAAGMGATAELVIGMIAPQLEPRQVAELGNRLLLPTIRNSDAVQPQGVSGTTSLFDCQMTKIIALMEETISDPLDMTTLCSDIGISTRHVERMFRDVFGQSPARFYKELRTRKAWSLIRETVMPLADIAVATGFGSRPGMAKAVQEAYGDTPTKLRARKSMRILKFT
jgi:transcriptional regulator GlxA family with amidase domain